MRPLILPDSGLAIDFKTVPVSAVSGYDGLVAIGANFQPATLLSAYRHGLFPWYKYKGMPYWYCPDPRTVLYPAQLHISKSMKNIINRQVYSITCDFDFYLTIQSCAKTKRKNEDATWIDPSYIEAYTDLHALGYAHSFEAWKGGQLVGGLYGIAQGHIFFGESMFSTEANASKLAFIQAVHFLQINGFHFIDCQISTDHLQSLGARSISKKAYLEALVQHNPVSPLDGKNWHQLFHQIMCA